MPEISGTHVLATLFTRLVDDPSQSSDPAKQKFKSFCDALSSVQIAVIIHDSWASQFHVTRVEGNYPDIGKSAQSFERLGYKIIESIVKAQTRKKALTRDSKTRKRLQEDIYKLNQKTNNIIEKVRRLHLPSWGYYRFNPNFEQMTFEAVNEFFAQQHSFINLDNNNISSPVTYPPVNTNQVEEPIVHNNRNNDSPPHYENFAPPKFSEIK